MNEKEKFELFNQVKLIFAGLVLDNVELSENDYFASKVSEIVDYIEAHTAKKVQKALESRVLDVYGKAVAVGDRVKLLGERNKHHRIAVIEVKDNVVGFWKERPDNEGAGDFFAPISNYKFELVNN